MKRILLLMLEVLIMLVAGVTAMFVRPFHITHVVWQNATQRRTLELDWLIAVVITFLLLLIIHTLRQRLRTTFGWTSTALLIAVVLGFAAKLGFKTAYF